MTFDHAWALLALLLPLGWAGWEWRETARRTALGLKAAAFVCIVLALSGPRVVVYQTKVAVAVLADTSASVDLTRRRGDAEEEAEKKQESQNLRAQRQRSQSAWRHRGRVPRSAPTPESNSCGTRRNADQSSTLAWASLRRQVISADSAFSGFDLTSYSSRLSPRLRVSASNRHSPCLVLPGFGTVARVLLHASASPRQEHSFPFGGFDGLGVTP
jgi:hypothetical protein